MEYDGWSTVRLEEERIRTLTDISMERATEHNGGPSREVEINKLRVKLRTLDERLCGR